MPDKKRINIRKEKVEELTCSLSFCVCVRACVYDCLRACLTQFESQALTLGKYVKGIITSLSAQRIASGRGAAREVNPSKYDIQITFSFCPWKLCWKGGPEHWRVVCYKRTGTTSDGWLAVLDLVSPTFKNSTCSRQEL